MEMENNNINGWNEWSKYVLKELERLSKVQEEINDRLGKIEVAIGQLQVKAGVWGVIGGVGTVLVSIGLMFLARIKF